MLRLRSLFIVLAFVLNSYSIEVVIVNSKINYRQNITLNKLSSSEIKKVKKYCDPVTMNDLKNNKYTAKRYLKKGTILCHTDIENYKKNSVVFNFGSIQIEREGKLLFENDDYIKIKKNNGKIEKIYKDGRLQ